METGRVISFPKTNKQLLADAQKHYKAAERELDRAARLFRESVLTDMLTVYEADTEKAMQTNRQGGFRKKLKAAGLNNETADAIIEAYLQYIDAQQLYNELAPRVGVRPLTLRQMLDDLHGRGADREQEPQRAAGGRVIHFTRYSEE